MSTLQDIQETRTQIILEINTLFDQLIETLEAQGGIDSMSAISEIQTEGYESIYPLSINSRSFKGKKPTGVLLGERGRVDVGTWKAVFREIMKHCNADPEKHVALMNLRGRVSGRERIFLAKTSEGMRSPLEISANLYAETHYDTETLLRIMTSRILDAIGYDYSGISVAIRNN